MIAGKELPFGLCLDSGMTNLWRAIFLIFAVTSISSSCGSESSSGTSTTAASTSTSNVPIPAIFSSFSKTVPGLSVGDCFNFGPKVIQIECSKLHDGQVIATGVGLDYTLMQSSSSTLWRADAEDKCAVYFKNFVGYEYSREEGRFRISILLAESISTTISCIVIDANDVKWAGTAENFIGSYETVSTGDCFLFPTDINDAIVVNCSQPHEGEMFLKDRNVGIALENSPYPTRNEWRQIASQICELPFFNYTGLAEDDKTISYSFTFPLEIDWPEVNRRVLSCVATSYSGELLSFSVRK